MSTCYYASIEKAQAQLKPKSRNHKKYIYKLAVECGYHSPLCVTKVFHTMACMLQDSCKMACRSMDPMGFYTVLPI